jgi:serine/threonine protein kinase
MKTELFLINGPAVVHAAVPPGCYLVGSAEEANIRLDDPSVSPRHARLQVEANAVTIEDLNSETGTMVGDRPAVGPTHLYEGETATLGSVKLRVRQKGDPQVLDFGPRYIRGSVVASGGMGAIHEARQAGMGRKVAMKVMLHAWQESSVARFLDEARITGMLEHPNIVPVHELNVDEEGQLYYTMKFVRGVTLAEVIGGLKLGTGETARLYPLTALLTIFQKVCDAVAFAHSRGVWHRDLKPENIMIGDFGEVLVMDWGLAKEAGFVPGEPTTGEAAPVEVAPGRTMDGAIIGTPAYMAPEQARGELSEVDRRADIYALGVILHEILYLQPPVRGASREEVVEKVAAGRHDAPERQPALHLPAQRVPDSLAAVCRQAMAWRREERYQQVQDLQADITAYQAGFATSAEQAGAAKQLSLFVKRNRRVSIAVAAAILALAAVSAWFTYHLARASWEATLADNERQSAVEELAAKAGGIREAAAKLRGEAENFIVQERADEAMQRLDAAVELLPEDPEFLARRADLQQSLWRFNDAARDYEAALARRPDEKVLRNLTLSRELAAGQSDDASVRARLEGELMAQDREEEIPLMYRAAENRQIAAGETSAQALLLGRLKSFAAQERWRTDERIEALPDGTLRVDLSGLQVRDLSALRGLDVRELNLADTDVSDATLLRGLKLRALDLTRTGIDDLSPLAAMPLEFLQLRGTEVTSLEPLRGMPLVELHADAPGLADFAAAGSLPRLERLTLPAHAAGVDLSGATALREVVHRRFQPSGPLPATEFRLLSEESDAQWQKLQPVLARLSVPDLGRERLTVRKKGTVDLDLRGTGVRNIAPLAVLPLRRLELDTNDAKIDLTPLEEHPTLEELNLAGADAPRLEPLRNCAQLRSLVVGRDAADLAVLWELPALERVGFTTEPDGLLARTSKEDFFSARVSVETTGLEAEEMPAPRAVENFDDIAATYAGWEVATRDGGKPNNGRFSWVPDPVGEGGRGGGYLAYRERDNDGNFAYFVMPRQLYAALGDLRPLTLEFDLRAPDANYQKEVLQVGVDLVVSDGERTIASRLSVRPTSWWSRHVMGLGGVVWAEIGQEDKIAPAEVVSAVLANPQMILIRAEYTSDKTVYGVDIDDIAFVDPNTLRRSSSSKVDE